MNGEIKRKIDHLRDLLVGKIPVPTDQVKQITLGLIYKFMSDIDEQNRELGGSSFFSGDYQQYAWKHILDHSLSAYERVVLYSEGLEKMSLNPNIPQLFRDIFKGAFLPFKDPATVDQFLKGLNEFEYQHSEDLGDAYEYLLSIMGSQGDAGQFRTPRHIIDFIVAAVEPQKEDRVLDPACGTAGFWSRLSNIFSIRTPCPIPTGKAQP
jgi:type I restriction enzyme M protein